MALGWLWWRAWFPVDAVDAAAVCVAGVVLGDMYVHSAWQVRHLVTWTSTLRGRRGTYGTVLALVARLVGVALGDMDSHFAWQVWHLATMDLHFAWQVWHLVTSTSTLRARQGAW